MTESDLKLEQLKQKLRHLRRSAWKSIVREGHGALTASKFGGTPWLKASERWPLCPNCNKPMHLILQLNLNELPESLRGRFGNGLLQFFYCTNIELDCEIVCQGWEPFSKIKLVRIVQPDHICVDKEIPKIDNLFAAKLIVGWEEQEDYPDCYQGTEDTNIMHGIMLNNDESDFLHEQEMYVTESKLAGWPTWIQYHEYPNCPMCNQPMNQFVFQFDPEDNHPCTWGDWGKGYLLQCPEHKVQLAFVWQC
ncbi:MAG: DUF1963 domain-containing protein [Microcoleus sp. SIO2G3]|nr:DUF1963 domain-containing protein [Microcoleus sp. SIO2G3]